MRRRHVWIGMLGGAALCACAGTAATSRWSDDAPTTMSVFEGTAAPAVTTLPRATSPTEATHTAAVRTTATQTAVAPAQETGATLALHYQHDICACDTKACWHEAAAAYSNSVGLAVPTTKEEGATIDAAFRETSACIKRIHAAEAADGAPPPSP